MHFFFSNKLLYKAAAVSCLLTVLPPKSFHFWFPADICEVFAKHCWGFRIQLTSHLNGKKSPIKAADLSVLGFTVTSVGCCFSAFLQPTRNKIINLH